jgi:outer membrane receptor protein involved in Fe transport
VKFSAGVSQQERLADEKHYGAITTLTWRPAVTVVDDFALETGFDLQRQDNISRRFRDTDRVREAQTRDQQFSLNNYGGYAQLVIKPVQWLKLMPGVRVDSYDGDFLNRLAAAAAPINADAAARRLLLMSPCTATVPDCAPMANINGDLPHPQLCRPLGLAPFMREKKHPSQEGNENVSHCHSVLV